MAAAAFWSYTHADNDASAGKIVRLAELIANEYFLLTGEKLECFVDIDVKWGEDWRDRINHALAEATFLVPVLTPNFFRSQECRKELLTFVREAVSLHRGELVLPILWTPVPDLTIESEDEAKKATARAQWQDWSSLRLQEETSAEHQQGVNELASRLQTISLAVTVRDVPIDDSAVAETDSNDDGFIELWGRAKPAMDRVGEELGQVEGLLEEMTAIVSASAEDLERAAQKSQPAALLTESRKLAKKLDPVADRIQDAVEEYSSGLSEIDAFVTAMIPMAAAHPQMYWDSFKSGYPGLLKLAAAGRKTEGAFRKVTGILQGMGSLSKDLKRTSRKIERGVTLISDGQAVFDEWERRIQRAIAEHDET